jgi:hypothetical protein
VYVRPSVCPYVCHQNVQRIEIRPVDAGRWVFYLAVSHLVVLDVTMVRDDSNLLYSDISRGDELKPN